MLGDRDDDLFEPTDPKAALKESAARQTEMRRRLEDRLERRRLRDELGVDDFDWDF